MFVKTLPLQSS